MNELRTLFSALVFYQYNMRALHWKVKGLGFDTKHELADNYVKQLDTYIDEIAEMLLMLNSYPMNLPDIVQSLQTSNFKFVLVNCDGDIYYSEEQMLLTIQDMFTHLVNLYDLACSDEAHLPEDIVSKLQEHQYYFRLESSYKGKNRLMNTTQRGPRETELLKTGLNDIVGDDGKDEVPEENLPSEIDPAETEAPVDESAFLFIS